nr:synaptobrevin, longin-like domain protein [Tanacetum cinerariifolium]
MRDFTKSLIFSLTIEDVVMDITATIDRNVKQLALMGYVTTSESLTFQKGHFSPQWKFFIDTILYCLSPKKTPWEQFSSNIATAIICLATNKTFNFSKLIFDAMHGEPSTPESPPSRITFSPSLSPQHTSINAPPTSQPPNIQTTPVAEETTPIPMTHLSKVFTHLDTKKVYSSALTKLILRVKKLERIVKTSKARRKAMIVNGQPKDQLGGFSVAKVLEDATAQGRSVGNVQTYTRQKRRVNTANALVSTADVSTASEMVNITSLKAMDKGKAVMQESEPTKKIKKRIQVQMSIDEELAWKLHEEELARTVQEVERQSTKEEKGKNSDDSSKPTRTKTLARKRAGVNDSQESVRKERLEDDTEKKELKAYLDIVPKDKFVMEVKSLATKADGSSKNYKIFSEMLDDFDRQDVMDLHRLVEERHTTTSPEGYDLMFWGDLKTLFEPDEENELWKINIGKST